MPKDMLDKLLRPLKADIQNVEAIFQNILSEMEEPLRSMLKTSLRGGKRLRPALVILAGRLFKTPRLKVHLLAAALEVLHSATLIHDDLVDNATLRRGRKTIHTVWPIGATVLAGDYLLAQSVCLLAQLKNPGVLKILAETLHTMSAGEIEYHYSLKNRKRREVYFRSINAKTASLFAGAMEMVGLLSHVEKNTVINLRNFGHEFGIAFQVVDDVLDLIGDEKSLGKPALSDLEGGIITLPVICYLERGNDDRIINKILAGKGNPKDSIRATEMIRKSGAIEDALTEARAHARKSKVALAHLPSGKYRQLLYDLVDYVVDRQH